MAARRAVMVCVVGTYSGEVCRGVVDPVMVEVVETSHFPHFPTNSPIALTTVTDMFIAD